MTGSMDKALGGYLLALAGEYCRVTGYAQGTVAMRAISQGGFFKAILHGRRINLAQFDRRVSYFSNNWPEGAVWPQPPAWPFPVPMPKPDAPVKQKPGRKVS